MIIPGQNGFADYARIVKFIYGLKVENSKLFIATEFCDPENNDYIKK